MKRKCIFTPAKKKTKLPPSVAGTDIKGEKGKQMGTFLEKKQDFDNQYENIDVFTCFLTEHLTFNKTTNFKKKNGQKNEQYYKWQFLYSIVQAGFFAKDYIGTEVQFPKGNKSSAPLKLDGAIFDDISWFDKYKDYHENGNNESLEWLREHLIVALEFKKEDNKNVSDVWDKQLKAYLNESRRSFCLAVLYDTERLYLYGFGWKILGMEQSLSAGLTLINIRHLNLELLARAQKSMMNLS